MARLLVLAAALIAVISTTASVGASAAQRIHTVHKQHNNAVHHQHAADAAASLGYPPSLRSSSSSAIAVGDSPNPKQPANPVIAVVTVQCSSSSLPQFNSCLDDYYVRWLEAQGNRVVALPIWWSWEKKQQIITKVNGVLFPGGGADGQAFTDYINNATEIINYALQKPGFFIWGTCQGFQVISIVMSKGDQSILTCDYEGMYPSMLPLDFTAYQPQSTLFGKTAEYLGVVETAKTKNSTLNYHHCGIAPENFKPTLADVKVISTNTDINGKPFISSLEVVANGVNIFATQFHPERPPYEFSQDAITHERGTIDICTYISRFAGERMQLNSQSFDSADDVNALTFDNYYHEYDGWGGGYYWMKL